jgi:hypothetical protein
MGHAGTREFPDFTRSAKLAGLHLHCVVCRVFPHRAQAKLLDATKGDLRKLLISNPLYPKMADWCAALLIPVTANKKHEIFPTTLAAEWYKVSDQGNRTVAVTFALFHICAVFPKTRGATLQVAAALSLKERIEQSDFKPAWSTLPTCVQNCITSFGK